MNSRMTDSTQSKSTRAASHNHTRSYEGFAKSTIFVDNEHCTMCQPTRGVLCSCRFVFGFVLCGFADPGTEKVHKAWIPNITPTPCTPTSQPCMNHEEMHATMCYNVLRC